RLLFRLRRAVKLRIRPRLRAAEMQQQQEGGQRGLCVLSPEADNGTAGAVRIVVDLEHFPLLPGPELHRLADIAPFRDSAVAFDPNDVPLAARQLAISQGFRSAVF